MAVLLKKAADLRQHDGSGVTAEIPVKPLVVSLGPTLEGSIMSYTPIV